ncbi:MAG: hypothetical protein ACRDDY_03955 [Clostridium sp.]|uniref:hypothetical protein n=1 Tax=Clostridium sp. TaxID=1506 RepID=UPI003EE58476
MDMQVLIGRESATLIPNFKYEGIGQDILELVEIGNYKGYQGLNSLNALLAGIERQEGVGRGAKLPIEHFNVFFQKGGLESSAPQMQKYIEEFTLKHSVGYNVMTYDYSQTDVYNAINEGIDLDAEARRNTSVATEQYVQYLAFSRLCALITGSSLSAKIPTDDAQGTGEYSDKFGFLRGEKPARGFLKPTAKSEKKYHYRGIKGDTLAKSDIFDSIQLITSYKTYSGKGVMALASPSKIYDLIGDTLQSTRNKDTHMLEGLDSTMVPRPFGCQWIPVPELEGHDFIIFLDEGKKDILFRRVEKAPQFRGFGIVPQTKIATFMSLSDVKGAKLRIFPEEWYVTKRESGVILDVKNKAKDANGQMADVGVTALEALALACQGAYDLEKAE